jgi:AraC-like DNA-binding protein
MNRNSGYALDANWRTLLKDLGVNPSTALRRAGLPADLFARSDDRMRTDDFYRLWEGIEAEVNDPMFPVRVGEALTGESFSPPLFAALCSPDLRTAAQRLSKYKALIGPMVLGVKEMSERLQLTFRWLDTSLPPPPSLVVFELVFIVCLARMATREHIRPVAVGTDKPPEPAREYERFFGVRVRRATDHSITFSHRDAIRPFLTANEKMWETFEPDLRRRLQNLDESASVSERVSALLLEFLPSGQCSIDAVCEKLIMSKRTLQRRLHEEGTNFQEILKKTRKDLAVHYLSRSTITSSEISYLLGFEDANSFFRAFNDWTGNTPESMRQSIPVTAH